MPVMTTQDIREYLARLRPFILTSCALLGVGLLLGVMGVSRFPEIAEEFKDSLGVLIKTFRGLPKLQLAAGIFFNNALKVLFVILLGPLLGVFAVFFLLLNGAAIAVALYISTHSKGLWLSLLAILPHGILEIPAVVLGTSVGLMLGVQAMKRLFGKTPAGIGGELRGAFKFFLFVIAPLLFVAALVESFVTPIIARF